MNKSQERLVKVVPGVVLIVLALVVTGQAAATPATTRATATTLDPIGLRPVWIFGNNVSKASMATPAELNVSALRPLRTSGSSVKATAVVGVQATPLVQVPARPSSRDPFSPPR